MNRDAHRPWQAAVLTALALVAAIVLFWHIEAVPVYLPYQPPGPGHLLGTDSSGRDLLRLLLRSTATSLTLGMGAALVATLIGAVVGCVAGYRRSLAGSLLMRTTDMVMLIPSLPLVIVLAAYLGSGIENVFLVIALTVWPSTARVVYARVLSLREQPFIVNARSMGAGTVYLIRCHILPNCADLLLAKAALTVAAAMLAEAGISFLGLGDPLNPSWGSMLHAAFTGAAMLRGAWWWMLPPLAGISLSVILFYMLGHFLTHRGSIGGPPSVPRRSAAVDDPQAIPRNNGSLLSVKDLTITFPRAANGRSRVVDQLNMTVDAGEKIAIVGATGSGKSLLLLSLLGLLPPDARTRGHICISGEELGGMGRDRLLVHRGTTIGYIPQNGGEALNPVLSIARQVGERAMVNQKCSHSQAYRLACKRLIAVGLPKRRGYTRTYPHQLSGGMRQRVLLAMALVGKPRLLLADEPTKGLDPDAVQAITSLLKALTDETLLVVTHDLAFAQALDGWIMVMMNGLVVELAPAAVFSVAPLHPYSHALVAAQPSRRMDINGINGNGWHDHPGDRDGCPYRPLCRQADERCRRKPPLETLRGHQVRCWQYAR
ncbi:oligopeptide/dipeptide ABC transporter ATP-binding protein [Desulfosarcina variabilis]|uniref:oligopeptide/dipeptide ABC transporter ATP-binding protein n=1 Tax=Desulfosarcina variabilis TaxID=2300 RepID=UPI003AFA0A72